MSLENIMRIANTVSEITDKLRETASGATEQLHAAGDAVSHGLRDTADVAAEGIRQSARSAEAAVHDVAASGKEIYKGTVKRTNTSLAGVERLVARNPVGALIAALGMGLVVGLMARK
jgi:ElaB/YqjD/DUF883 family membrane-anchored ribosome-binding protein